MKKSKKPTLVDVAQLAQVSPAVVSYVLNNGPRGTSPAARERVLKAIEELNYHPSALASSLRQQRTHTIGVLFFDYSPHYLFLSPYSAGILTGIAEELKQKKYILMLIPFSVNDDLQMLTDTLNSGRMDGVIVRFVSDPKANEEILEKIKRSGLPCIGIERSVLTSAQSNYSSITIDDEGGAYKATLHLLSLGHTRIAHIQGDPRYLSASSRLQGYKKALTEAGISYDPDLVKGGTWDSKSGALVMDKLLNLQNPPTAVFAANDNLAFRAVQFLQKNNLRVPTDIAVVGFDDIPLAQEMQPELTTVRIPLFEMGKRAVEMVLQLIENTDERNMLEPSMFPLELIKRESA